MRRTPMAPRVTPLRRGAPIATVTPLHAASRGNGDRAAVVPLRPAKPRKHTGFSDAVKLAVRARAGGGDPEKARCEACGTWLGTDDGQIQHRLARGMGGTSLYVTDSIVNAALLCGSPFTGCHGLAERRDPLLRVHGFWLRQGDDPAMTPIMLASPYGSGITVWLQADGTYGGKPSGGTAA